MKWRLWTFVWLAPLMHLLAGDDPTQVGDFIFPPPSGFIPVTASNACRILDARVAPGNTRLAWFISASDMSQDSAGIGPRSTRSLSVQALTRFQSNNITTDAFKAVKEALRNQNELTRRQEEDRIPGIEKRISLDPEHAFPDSAPGSVNRVPLPAHDESEDHLAFSIVVHSNGPGRAGNSEPSTGVCTATLLRLRGRIVYLYAYGGAGDLEWSRSISKEWLNAIRAANP